MFGVNIGVKYELNRLEIIWGFLVVDLIGGCWLELVVVVVMVGVEMRFGML